MINQVINRQREAESRVTSRENACATPNGCDPVNKGLTKINGKKLFLKPSYLNYLYKVVSSVVKLKNQLYRIHENNFCDLF